MPSFYEAVYRLVRDIPLRRVMTYGQIATILGSPRAARAVGYAMLASDGRDDVPWHRVINAQGGISIGGAPERPIAQRKLLEGEGVVFDDSDTCDLAEYRWEPANPDEYYFHTHRDLPF